MLLLYFCIRRGGEAGCVAADLITDFQSLQQCTNTKYPCTLEKQCQSTNGKEARGSLDVKFGIVYFVLRMYVNTYGGSKVTASLKGSQGLEFRGSRLKDIDSLCGCSDPW